jgi:hypothetical protein
MKTRYWLCSMFLGLIALAGCIKVELKDERVIPEFYQVVLVTHTPSIVVMEQDTATPPPSATHTQAPAPTATPLPSSTEISLPTATPVTPSPVPAAVVSMSTWCRRGPGTIYPGISYLSPGEQVTLVGRNPEGTWWLLQKSDGTPSCWASKAVIDLQGGSAELAIVDAPPTPYQGNPIQPNATATQRPRHKPPRSTPAASSAPTDTPDPYPYPPP